ncbi:hypothetical protein FGAF1005_44930 (plasmid) [Escherichia coli]|nr:hypothetical protein FGAF1005_44930 [Escherichia coli]
MLGGADNPNGELPSYITGANIVTTAGSARSFPGGAKLLLPSGSSGISPQWTFPTGDAHHVTGQLSGGRRKSF